MSLLIQWLLYAVSIILAAYALPGVSVSGFGAALLTALVLALVNTLIRPILLILTFPITILTLGLFVLVINTLMILLTSAMVTGFQVRNFWWALLFGIVLSVIHYLLRFIVFK